MPDEQPVLVPGATEATLDTQTDATLDAAAPVETVEPEFVPEEQVAPHGAAARAASDFASMTSTEVLAGIKAGTISLGNRQNVLCRDGYLTNPNLS